MVVFLAILYVKGKDVRENYHMKNSIMNNLDEKELKKLQLTNGSLFIRLL